MPDFSPLEKLLMHYAAGTLGPRESALVAAHLALNARARAIVAQYEAIGGGLICEAPPVEVGVQCLSIVMERIERGLGALEPSAAPCRQELPVPEAVQEILDCLCAGHAPQWKKSEQGCITLELEIKGAELSDGILYLMRLEPLEILPRHRHQGVEIMLVLEGGFSDESGVYQAGDVEIVNDDRFSHQPRALDKGCVCLVFAGRGELQVDNAWQRLWRFFQES